MINGVKIKKLKVLKDERGFLMEILRTDDKIFQKFGQVYLTAVHPGYVKGWHYHKNQTDNFVCVNGKVKVVLYDQREESETKGELQEYHLGFDEPIVLQIPPGILHGFESDSQEDSYIVNIPTEVYDYNNPDEFRVPFNSVEIPYKWKGKGGG